MEPYLQQLSAVVAENAPYVVKNALKTTMVKINNDIHTIYL